ncbi:MAG TPA: hypothetical protein VHQ90_08680 [Thermoanaerobaculia bacterium]|nr:hypothetical protein [Thermoanaerobaculia bacterium]
MSDHLSYGLTLAYNNLVWYTYEVVDYNGASLTASVPAAMFNAEIGWTLSLGRFDAPLTTDVTRDTYTSPNGATHTFYPTLHMGETTASITAVPL